MIYTTWSRTCVAAEPLKSPHSHMTFRTPATGWPEKKCNRTVCTFNYVTFDSKLIGKNSFWKSWSCGQKSISIAVTESCIRIIKQYADDDNKHGDNAGKCWKWRWLWCWWSLEMTLYIDVYDFEMLFGWCQYISYLLKTIQLRTCCFCPT